MNHAYLILYFLITVSLIAWGICKLSDWLDRQDEAALREFDENQ